MKIRLDKFLTSCGLGSRKEVIKLLKSKKIKVNQEIIKDPAYKIDPEKDIVFFEDIPLFYQRFYYYKFYKPKGVITSTKDKEKLFLIYFLRTYQELKNFFLLEDLIRMPRD